LAPLPIGREQKKFCPREFVTGAWNSSWSDEAKRQIDAVIDTHQGYEEASQAKDRQHLPGGVNIRGSIGKPRKSLNQSIHFKPPKLDPAVIIQ
jgi:hypothetical protein